MTERTGHNPDPADSDDLRYTVSQQGIILGRQSEALSQIVSAQQELFRRLDGMSQTLSGITGQASVSAPTVPAAASGNNLSSAAAMTPENFRLQPEPFHGNTEACGGFLLQCQLLFQQAPRYYYSDHSKITLIINSLRDKALQWAQAFLSANPISHLPFERFIDEFKLVFDQPRKQDEAARKLLTLRQRNRSVSEHIIDFRILAVEAGWSDPALRGVFYQSLNEAIKDHLCTQPEANTFEELAAAALRSDIRLQERNVNRSHAVKKAPTLTPLVTPMDCNPVFRSETSRTSPEEPMQIGHSKITAEERLRRRNEDTSVTTWDVCDSYCGQEENSGVNPDDLHHLSRMSGRKIAERSSSSTTGSSVSSLSDMETQRDIKNTTVDPNEVLLSESFQKILLVMEKTIATVVHWPELAAFRQLPALEGELQSSLHPEDLDSAVKQVHEEESSSPTIKPLWTFDSELTRGRMITSMTWNKKNLNILAVSYSDCDPSSSRRSFICCWSLNNPLWPQRTFSCPSRVTSMDFSSSKHGHLAVGMHDGSVAIYNVQIQDRGACVATSSKCPNRHLRPVWQVAWNKQESKFSRLEAEEVLVSMSADGRISMWQHCNNQLECTDLMKIRRIHDDKRGNGVSKMVGETILSEVSPGHCLDFHPKESDIYLVGSWDGLIHKCSLNNNQQFLDSYQKHLLAVNDIQWSPFSPDLFLSCSSDCTIQLWRHTCLSPLLSFKSVHSQVCAVRWSPERSTVFAAIYRQQVEVWELSSNILSPAVVHQAAAGVTLTALLFARGTDCVLVGDSEGKVTVYQLRNFTAEGKEGKSLDDILASVS